MEIAFIGLLGVFVGTIISSIAAIVVAKWQLNMSFKNAKIDLLQKKIGKLEGLLLDFNSVKIDVQENEVLPQQMIGRAMMSFSEKVSYARQCFHYFSPELVSQLEGVTAEIGAVYFDGKTGIKLDGEYVKALFTRIQEAEAGLRNEVSNNLNRWQRQVESLLIHDSDKC